MSGDDTGRRRIVPVRADLATAEGVETRVTQVRSLGRPVEVLALIAGVGVAGPFVDTPLDDDLRLIALNVTSVVHAAKVAAADGAAGAGAVLVTSSVAATMPGPWYATYAASKAFVPSFA